MIVIDWVCGLIRHNKRTVGGLDLELHEHAVTVSADVAWNNFLASRHMHRIITARRSNHLPTSPDVWTKLCKTACDLWIQLDDEGLIDYLPTVYPTLCLVMKGNYYFHIYSGDSRRLLFDEEPFKNLVRAIAACPYSPYTFAERVLKTFSHQLILADFAGRQNPLHVLCSHTDQTNPDRKHESLIPLFSKACTEAAHEVDSEGLYPLHHACRSAYTWSTGISALVNAAPQAAQVEHSGQTPFIMAAFAYAKSNKTLRNANSSELTSAQEEEMSNMEADVVTTLFELLRLYPDIIKC